MYVQYRNLTIIFLALLALIVTACSQVTTEETAVSPSTTQTKLEFPKNADGYADINVDQLAAILPDKDFTLINVHIPYAGEIPETDLFIPFSEIDGNLNQLPDKDTPLVVYCRSGSMSTQAAETLANLGYTNIMEVDGGMNAWQSAGQQLITK